MTAARHLLHILNGFLHELFHGIAFCPVAFRDVPLHPKLFNGIP